MLLEGGPCRKELTLQACNDNPADAEFAARVLSKFAMREKGNVFFLKK